MKKSTYCSVCSPSFDLLISVVQSRETWSVLLNMHIRFGRSAAKVFLTEQQMYDIPEDCNTT